MIGIFFVVLFATLFSALNAQEFSAVDNFPHTCATPQIDRVDVEQLFADLKNQNPQLYRDLLQKELRLRKFNAANSGLQQFWAVKITGETIKPEDFYTLEATLRKEGNSIRIWVEDESWNSQYVTQTEVDIIFNALTVSTPPGSLDPNKGILEIDTMLFGQPPNKAGDGITNFLILDIQDTYDPESGDNEFVAGYFFPNDQTDGSKSNKMDLLYIDAFPGIFFNGERRTKTVLATTAHELQHLIHYRYDRFEENWVNEGLSELSSTVCGYGIGNPFLFMQDPNRNLTGWSNALEDYSRVGLWTIYAFEQLGYEFIQKLTRNTTTGINGFNSALTQAGSGINFETLFRDWTVANYINDVNADPRYGYRHEEAKELKASVTEEVFNFPQLVNVDLDRYAARYFRLSGQDTLEIEFFSDFFSGTLTRQSSGSTGIFPLQENPLIYPEFNKDEDYALVLNNTGNPFEYEFCAYAPFSLTNIDLNHDDDEVDFALTHTGIAANKFIVPQNGLSLNRIKFLNFQGNAPLKIHLYRVAEEGVPGSDLIPPIDTVFAATNAWIEITLPEGIPLPNAGEVIFIGIEADTFAYDSDSNGDGKSYFYTQQSDWLPLSDFKAGGNPLTGSWMIRAVLRGGLVASGSKGCSPTPVTNFAISKIFPNPSRGSISVQAEINAPGEVTLTLYNLLGEKVSEYRQTFTGAAKSSAIHWVNVETFYGQPVASGIYFLRAAFKNAETQKTETADVQKLVMVR